MNINQVALQLYTLRKHLSTPSDVAAAMKKVREIGYRAVQVSGMGPIEESELVTILDGEGLVLCATHEPSDMVLDEPEKVVERLRKLKCRLTAYPFPRGIDFGDEGSVSNLIEKLNNAGKVLHEAGQILTYHNHAHEYRKLKGKPILDLIYEKTDPRYVQGELDTYWVQMGGADILQEIGKLNNRLPMIHLKDCAVAETNQPVFAEIGQGNMNFKAIIAAAEKVGCEWFIVEQDVCPADEFDSVRMSFDYISENLLS